VPYTTVTTNQQVTSSFLNTNYRDQVVSTVLAASKPAGTEGQVIGVTDSDRLEIYSGTVWLPGPPWSATGRVGFRLTDATNRSIPTGTGTYTSLTFATEVTDTDGFIAAPGTTITIPANRGGLYIGYCTHTWASSPGANSVAQFLKNGATNAGRVPIGAGTQSLVSTIYFCAALAAADTLQIQLSQGSGGAINVNPSEWEMWRISA
jgi:hypothetical protein